MSDQDEDKKNIPEESTDQVSENQSSVDQNNQPERVEKQDNYSSQEITEISFIWFFLYRLYCNTNGKCVHQS